MQSRNIPHERVCLLDPKSSLALLPSDGNSDGDTGKFMWFLTGSSLVCVPLPFFYPLAFFLRFTLVF